MKTLRLYTAAVTQSPPVCNVGFPIVSYPPHVFLAALSAATEGARWALATDWWVYAQGKERSGGPLLVDGLYRQIDAVC